MFFFLLSNGCNFQCSEVHLSLSVKIYLSKSKITDFKNYLKITKYTKKLLNYSNVSKSNSLLYTSGASFLVRTHTHTYAQTHTHTHTHTYIYAQTHTHTHTHAHAY